MLTTDKQLVRQLKTAGFSNTKVRSRIFAVLSEHESMTMKELVAELTSTVDRASIYRTVELFEKLGIVQRVQIGWKYRLELSDAFNPHHHHIHCISCQRVVSLKEDPALEKQIHTLAQQVGFALSSHQLELAGTCQSCRDSASKK